MKLKKIAISMFILSILVLAGCQKNNEQIKEPDSLGIVTEAFKQYVSQNQTQCAATTWICDEGMQQFYDETGCGCEQETPIPVEPIGGDKDKEGCLIGAGYSWNESIGACVRSWELNENEAKAAQIAVSPISARPVTVVEVITARCPGCFEVKIQTGEGAPYIVSIKDWKISNENS
jgi:hypothetical protein